MPEQENHNTHGLEEPLKRETGPFRKWIPPSKSEKRTLTEHHAGLSDSLSGSYTAFDIMIYFSFRFAKRIPHPGQVPGSFQAWLQD